MFFHNNNNDDATDKDNIFQLQKNMPQIRFCIITIYKRSNLKKIHARSSYMQQSCRTFVFMNMQKYKRLVADFL